MQVLGYPGRVPRGSRPLVLAAGFFDGVHRGHQRVIRAARARARALGGRAWVLTFDLHPLRVLRPQAAPPLLTCLQHKILLLERAGVDGCLLVPFSPAIARTDAMEFIRKLRADLPALRELFVGPNWRFGRGARGNPRLLLQNGRRLRLGVRVIRPVSWKGRIVSSTRIRDAVARGNLAEATAMLGRPFSILGRVVRGRRVGRTLGYPTANLEIHGEELPPCGVYAAVIRIGRRLHRAVVNLGVRPTFGAGGRFAVEAHVLGLRRDLYDLSVEVFFVRRLRSERLFPSEAALCTRLARDVARARRVLTERAVKECLYTGAGRRI